MISLVVWCVDEIMGETHKKTAEAANAVVFKTNSSESTFCNKKKYEMRERLYLSWHDMHMGYGACVSVSVVILLLLVNVVHLFVSVWWAKKINNFENLLLALAMLARHLWVGVKVRYKIYAHGAVHRTSWVVTRVPKKRMRIGLG